MHADNIVHDPAFWWWYLLCEFTWTLGRSSALQPHPILAIFTVCLEQLWWFYSISSPENVKRCARWDWSWTWSLIQPHMWSVELNPETHDTARQSPWKLILGGKKRKFLKSCSWICRAFAKSHDLLRKMRNKCDNLISIKEEFQG